MPLSRRRLLGGALMVAVGAACRDRRDDAAGGARDGGTAPAASSERPSAPGPTTPTTGAAVGSARPAGTLADAVERFLDAPDTNGAALLAVAMADSGDTAWVPYVLDLLRFNGDPLSDGQIMASLQRLTGRPVLDDVLVALVTFGSWFLDEQPVPAVGYDAWKRRLYERVEPAAGSWFVGVDDRVLAELVWAGTSSAGPGPLRPAGRRGVGTVPDGTLTADELVFAVELDGVAVAYPERFVAYHEVVDDRVAGVDVAVSYCPLSRTARAVRRGELALRASGLVRRSNRVLVDDASGLLVQQRDGVVLGGAGAGRSLDPVPVRTTNWSAWSRRHPDGEVLLVEGGPSAPAYRPGGASADYDAYGRLSYPVRTPPAGLPPKATVAAVTLGGAALAVDVATVARQGPVVVDWPGAPVPRVLAVAAPEGARLYDASSSARSAGRVEVVRADGEQAVLADGEVLAALPADRLLWFSWYDLHPATTWWPRR